MNKNNFQLSVDFKSYSLTTKEEKIIFHEEFQKGGTECKAVISPQSDQMIITSEADGWYHLYLYSFNDTSLLQLTKGEFEDNLSTNDFPVWSPDGTKIAYCSNQGNLTNRQIHIYDTTKKNDRCLTTFHGVNFDPLWLPSGAGLVFSRASATRGVELVVLESITDPVPKLITGLFPRDLQEQLREPEKISYQSAKNFTIEAFLHKPYDFDPTKKYPALVYCHGGPQGGQLKAAWEDSPNSVSKFFGWNQYLASKGYFVLEVNMRGGSGYGRKFRHGVYLDHGVGDVEDCANAGRYLQNHPNVDPKRVGIYGVSFGGYMTYHNITRHPEIFALGIANVGLWNLDLWKAWLLKTYGDNGAPLIFNSGLGKEENPEIWKQASPHNYRAQLQRPIIAFQGMNDDSITEEQVYDLSDHCLKNGLEYVAHIYPSGGHVWGKRYIWRDAFKKYQDALDKYL